jgi:hypothetical protein
MRTFFSSLSTRALVFVSTMVLLSSFKHEGGHFAGNYSYYVSPAGDVNGDGYADILMSAFTTEFGISKDGKVYLYYGTGSGITNAPVWTGVSNQDASNFGEAVANAGDVNGDGFADIIVGAPRYSNGEENEGAAFVYFGTPGGLPSAPNWVMEGNQSNGFFGVSVAGGGDVNKDGYADVVVGAHFYDNGETNEGRVFVYLGSPNGLAKQPIWTAEGNQVGANFGKSVACAGDVNKDGYSDVLVGAPNFDNGQNNEGRAFLYLGSNMGLTQSPAWTGESNQADAAFGNSVAFAGDVNGDSFSDIVIGANRYDEGQSNVGKIYVYMGAANGLSLYPDWTYTGNIMDGNLGIAVATAGDVNGDGFGEVIVGSFGSNPQNPKGIAYVFAGSVRGMTNMVTQIAVQNNPQAVVGQSVSTAGDINGDGYADVIAGVILDTKNPAGPGKAMLVNGSSKGLKLGSDKDIVPSKP